MWGHVVVDGVSVLFAGSNNGCMAAVCSWYDCSCAGSSALCGCAGSGGAGSDGAGSDGVGICCRLL